MHRTASVARPTPPTGAAPAAPAAAEPTEHRGDFAERSPSVSPTTTPRDEEDDILGGLDGELGRNFSNLSFKSGSSLEMEDAPAAAAPTANMADARDNAAHAAPEPAPAAASRAAQLERAARMGAGVPPEQPDVGAMLEVTSSLGNLSIGSASLLPQSSANSQASSLGLGDMDLPNFAEWDGMVDHEVHKAEVMELLEGDLAAAPAPGAQGGLPLRQAAPAEPEPEPDAGGAPKPAEAKKASCVPLSALSPL